MAKGKQSFGKALWAVLLPLLLMACTTVPAPPPPPPPPLAVPPPPPPPPASQIDDGPTRPSDPRGPTSYGYSGAPYEPPRRVVRRLVVRPPAPEATASDIRPMTSAQMSQTSHTSAPSATSAAGQRLCAITKSRLPPSVCDELMEQNQLTQTGVDAAPTTVRMQLKQSVTYTYSIGAQGNEAIVRRNAATGSAPISMGEVAFGHFNYAKLSGSPGIKIEPLDSEVQDTLASPTPVWRWKLTALDPGAHQLTLDAGVELRAANTAPVRLGQNAKRIDVTVDVTGVNKFAQLASDTNTVLGISTDLLKKIALFLGAIGAALAAYRALRGKAKADPAS